MATHPSIRAVRTSWIVLKRQKKKTNNFFIHSSADGHLGCFHILAIVNSAAVNNVSLSILVSSGYMPRRGIAGSYGFFCFFFYGLYLFFLFLFFYWRIIALQNFVVLCQTSTWISHRHTYIPSLLKLWYIYTMGYYSAINRNVFESVLMR